MLCSFFSGPSFLPGPVPGDPLALFILAGIEGTSLLGTALDHVGAALRALVSRLFQKRFRIPAFRESRLPTLGTMLFRSSDNTGCSR